jgi:hypothetical protein
MVVAAAVFAVLAIVKPWTALPGYGERPAVVPRPAPPSLEPRPDAGAISARDVARHCPAPASWRVFSHQSWGDRAVRSWRLTTVEHAADGPTDSSIPVSDLGLSTIDLLGYCAPWDGTDRPPALTSVAVWRLEERRLEAGQPDRVVAVPFAIRHVLPVVPSSLAALFAPAVDTSGDPGPRATTAWPAGRYVFHLAGDEFDRWWGVDVGRPRAAAALHAPLSGAPVP